MTTSYWNTVPKVGDIVYEPFNPMKYGKVINLTYNAALAAGSNNQLPPNANPYATKAEIKWKDGTISSCLAAHVNNLQALIDDHKKKLQKHINSMAAAQSL
jgi:hypothetical protein